MYSTNETTAFKQGIQAVVVKTRTFVQNKTKMSVGLVYNL